MPEIAIVVCKTGFLPFGERSVVELPCYVQFRRPSHLDFPQSSPDLTASLLVPFTEKCDDIGRAICYPLSHCIHWPFPGRKWDSRESVRKPLHPEECRSLRSLVIKS